MGSDMGRSAKLSLPSFDVVFGSSASTFALADNSGLKYMLSSLVL